MSLPDRNGTREPLVPSTERNKNKRQGSGAFQKRLEKRRIFRSRQADAERINALIRKYDLSTDELSDPSDDSDVILTYHDEVVAHFTWDDDNDYDIPEGVVETSEYHICYHQSGVEIIPDQLDGIFDPEPWRFRSDSFGSDCSILDIRERMDEELDVEMQGNLVVEHSPSDEVVVLDVCPSTSNVSVCGRSCSILQPGTPPRAEVVSPRFSPSMAGDVEPIYTGASPVYEGMSDDDSDGGSYQRDKPVELKSVPPDENTASTSKRVTHEQSDVSSPLRVKLRSGKTLGLSRTPTFRVGWKGSTMTLAHRKCFVRQKTLAEDSPIKVVLTNVCCWDVSTGRFPDALHIAVVGGKNLGPSV